MSEAKQAFVTLATSDAYIMGSLVVGKCLRRHGTTRKLVVMVSPDISREARLSLEDVFDEVIVVDMLDSRDRAHLFWLGRPDLGVTFTKLHCWTLIQYTKCVFLDADTLVLCNVDELFEREELSAAPDPGWPDCFNSGVFVFRPSLETHSRLLEHGRTCGSFDGGDQGILNTFFSDWAIKDINKHLPFIYNLSVNAIYTYLPAFHKYGHQARIVHFLGRNKPWHVSYKQQPSTEVAQWDSNRNLEKFVNLWWAEYYSHTKTHVNVSYELKDAEPIEQLEMLAAAPCSTHVAALPHRSPPSATSPTAPPHPHSCESVSQAEDREERIPSESLGKLTLNASSSSTCHQLEETCSNPDVVSAADPEDLDKSEHQEPPAEQQQEEEEVSGAEGVLMEASSDTARLEALKENLEHRKRWEEGQIDYLGKDAFENIRLKLDQFLN
ncbi:glycogenin-2 [Tachysurus fulvidraco]|uniref:glycogenin-2 n=1 Tax=Tachysurus fulvidraco TaxID=1234273 RepID=UPI000F4FD6D5|nr:glycogenin-2 [Tachysurus fulvidraco]